MPKKKKRNKVEQTNCVQRFYRCAAGSRVAFAADPMWRAQVRVRVDEEWQWSIALAADDPSASSAAVRPSTRAFARSTRHGGVALTGGASAVHTSATTDTQSAASGAGTTSDSGGDVASSVKPTPVNVASVSLAKQRCLLVSRERGRWGTTVLRVAAPLTIENLTPFAVEFAHDHGVRGGVLKAGGSRCVYEPRLLTAPLSLRLLPYARWSPPIKVKRGAPAGGKALVQRTGVTPPGERADLTLLLGAAGKPGRARTLYIGVPFVLANRSDIELELRQRSHNDGARLPLGATKPFSWNVTGPRQVCLLKRNLLC